MLETLTHVLTQIINLIYAAMVVILHAPLPMTGSLCCLSQCQCNAAGIAQSIFVIDLSIQEQPIGQMLFAVMQQVHTCLRSDTAATGSVAATMAPNRKI